MVTTRIAAAAVVTLGLSLSGCGAISAASPLGFGSFGGVPEQYEPEPWTDDQVAAGGERDDNTASRID